jgi:hypothetical protein
VTFRLNEWHHGYLGCGLILLGRWLGPWLWVPGATLLLDDLIEHTTGFGALLWLYGRTLWRIPAVQRLNAWLDHLFGK